MDALLFQNTAILWIGGWISSLIVALVTTGIVFLSFFFIKNSLHRPRKKPPSPYIWTRTQDPEYRAKTLEHLKSYLLERYVPHHVTAHTADEIRKYVRPSGLADILKHLESSLYSDATWHHEDAEKIDTALKRLIHE